MASTYLWADCLFLLICWWWFCGCLALFFLCYVDVWFVFVLSFEFGCLFDLLSCGVKLVLDLFCVLVVFLCFVLVGFRFCWCFANGYLFWFVSVDPFYRMLVIRSL